MKCTIFCDVTPCILIDIQLGACAVLVVWPTFRLWRWRNYIPPKRRWSFIELHGVTSPKIVHFIATTVRISNPKLGFFLISAIRWRCVQFHASAALSPLWPLDRHLGWIKSLSGRSVEDKYLTASWILNSVMAMPTELKSIIFWIWRLVVRWVSTNVSEEHIASIFRVEEIGSANQRASRWQACRCLPPACSLVWWTYLFDPEDGGDMFLRNVGWNSTDYTALYPRRWYSS
jgi:hypothetical protein